MSKENTEKWPPISHGTKVRTTEPNMALRDEWTEEGWANKKWGMEESGSNSKDLVWYRSKS